jgi:hypothetical protein
MFTGMPAEPGACDRPWTDLFGATAGAAVNAAVMDHYQDLARAHFTVRRLERTYSRKVARHAYDGIFLVKAFGRARPRLHQPPQT